MSHCSAFGRNLATVGIWAAAIGLILILFRFRLLTGSRASFIIFGAFIITGGLSFGDIEQSQAAD